MTLLLRPNPASGVPVYRQLVEQVRLGLETGALQPGDVLPDVLPLAEALVVHPNAVARAYREMEGQQLVTRSSGVLRATAPPAFAGTDLVSALTAENRRLTARIAADAVDRAAHARELDTARDVQHRLLPHAFVAIGGVDYAGASRAALAVGGDYYDFIPRPGHRLAIALGDVCGKGIPAALLMASLRAYLHSELARPDAKPAAVVSTLNQRLYESAPANRFATFFFAQYDTATRELEYVNAGHNAPILIGRHREVRLDTSSLALGLMPATIYSSHRVTLEAGDRLVAFTDGISDATTGSGEEWGEARLMAAIDAHRGSSASALVDGVFAAVDETRHRNRRAEAW
jgi:phosphoserine phosphatase RsbU/P